MMKNSVQKNLVYLFVICVSIFFLFSCKVNTVRAAEVKIEKEQNAKAKEDQRAYKKAYKRHLNKQDKATKKRMKKNAKEKKKATTVPIKDRTKNTCPRYKK
jgi:hypothetical protein